MFRWENSSYKVVSRFKARETLKDKLKLLVSRSGVLTELHEAGHFQEYNRMRMPRKAEIS